MQVLSELFELKYFYDKIPLNRLIEKNMKELTGSSQHNFNEEVNNFTYLRNDILLCQYKGLRISLLNKYQEYLFFFHIFKQKKLLKWNKTLYTNDFYDTNNKKMEYELEREDSLILFNIGLLKTALARSKKNAEDVKLKSRISSEAVGIFQYLFNNLIDGKLKNAGDINCVSSYILLCVTSAYHQQLFYNIALMKKCKRNLLTKLSFNIYTYFNNIILCLEGKILDDVFPNADEFNKSVKMLQSIRSSSGYFYNFCLVNKLIFLSVSNYHFALKFVQLEEGSVLKVKRYEEDKIGEIISRLQYGKKNVEKSEEICRKMSIRVSLSALKEKIETLLQFFEYENKHIYFESIPTYESLESLKGTEGIKVKELTISDIYTKRKISPELNFLFNEKSKTIYERYNREMQNVYETMNKRIRVLDDQYKLINLSHRKNILFVLNNTIFNIYNCLRQIPTFSQCEEKLSRLQNIERILTDITTKADMNLVEEHKNHVHFQKNFVGVCISQDSMNSYNNFLFHLDKFKTILNEIHTQTTLFRTFIDENFSKFQMYDMDVDAFFEYIVNQLNQSIDFDKEVIERNYIYYKELLNVANEQGEEGGEKEAEKEGVEKEGEKEKGSEIDVEGENEKDGKGEQEGEIQIEVEIEGAKDGIDRKTSEFNQSVSNYTEDAEKKNTSSSYASSFNFSSFYRYLNANKLTSLIEKNTNSNNLTHYDILYKYEHVQLEEKIYFVIVAIYFSLKIRLDELNKDLSNLKSNYDEEFINSLNNESEMTKMEKLLDTQKEKLKIERERIEEEIVSFEKEIHIFYNFYHDYNKLESFKAIDEINKFLRELREAIDGLHRMTQTHTLTMKSAYLFQEDINKYIFMRESERNKISVQPMQKFPNNLQNDRYYM